MQLNRLAAAALLACLATASLAQVAPATAPSNAPAAHPHPARQRVTQANPADPTALPSAKTAEKIDKEPDNPTETELRNAELLYEVLVGDIAAATGDTVSAFPLLLNAARKANDERLYRQATETAFRARNGDWTLMASRAWKTAFPQSRDANRYVLQILLALNRVPETAEPLATELSLSESGPARALTYAAIPALYARVSDRKAALAVVEKAAAADLERPALPRDGAAAWSTLGRMRLAASDNAGALDAAERAQKLDPSYEGPAIIGLELMDPKEPRAEPIVRRYLDSAGKPLGELRLGYARVLLEAQRGAEAGAELQLLTAERPDFAEGWLLYGSQQAQEGQYGPAEQSIQTFLAKTEGQAATDNEQVSRSRDQAYLVMAQIAEKRGDGQAAEAWLKRVQNAQALVAAQMRRASLLASQGKLGEARKLVQQLPERSPEDRRMKLMAEVQLVREHGKQSDAYNLLQQAHQKAPDDNDLAYDLAMSAEKLGRFDEMERLLRALVVKKPDYHHAYNALGYSLAERGVRLTEARDLINKALEYAPNDPFIRDSLGWVEFRMGNRAEAIRILDAAYKTKPDVEIAAHLGEVLWADGQKDRALAIWKEGQMLNRDNDTLKQTLKRLRVNL